MPVPGQEVIEEALDLAVRYEITAYDACYVAVAQGEQVPLVTADERLAKRFAGTAHRVERLGSFAIPALP